MAKRVVFIHGSPRANGNTRALARVVMEGLGARGIATAEIDVPRLDFTHPGCIACFKCQASADFGCHVDDGLGRAVASLPEYDALVLATPIYWFSSPAQVKMFIDRMFSLIKFGDNDTVFSPLRGKPLALLATGGSEQDENLDILQTQWRIPAERLGMPFLFCLVPFCNVPPGEAAHDPAMAAVARELGARLGRLLGEDGAAGEV